MNNDDTNLDGAKKSTSRINEDIKEAVDDLKNDASNFSEDSKKSFDDTKKSADDFSKDTKKKFDEFTEDGKKTANEFAEDAKKTFTDGKTIAIVAHLHFIGWIIAYFLNRDNKTELGSFYLRQTLGIFLLSLFFFIPIVGIFISLFALVLWIMSLVNALGGNTKPVVAVGDKFQEWFISI